MNEIRKILQNAKNELPLTAIDAPFINRYIERIDVTVENPLVIRLEVKLLTGEKCTKFLEKLRKSRAVAFSKKMVESYENSIKTK